MKRVFLVLAILGAVAPYIFFIQFFTAEDASLGGFVSGIFVNQATVGFAVDLVFSSLVFWLWMVHQRQQGKGPNPALFIALNLLIGLSCALPAYLYARSE